MKKKKLIPDTEKNVRLHNKTVVTKIKTVEDIAIDNQILIDGIGLEAYKKLRKSQYMQKKYGGSYRKIWPHKSQD